MNASSWREVFREFLKKAFGQNGGDLTSWPDSTIDDAPMAFVQAVYLQMGGDPNTLDLTKTPNFQVDAVLKSIYEAVGGTDTTVTLIDDDFDARTEKLWDYFVFLGGSPIQK